MPGDEGYHEAVSMGTHSSGVTFELHYLMVISALSTWTVNIFYVNRKKNCRNCAENIGRI